MIKDKVNKTEAKKVKVVEVDIKKDTIHKEHTMIKVTMTKDAIQIKTENMAILLIKHLEGVKNTKLNTDVN